MLWQELREEEFEAAIARSKGLCILPIGCLEKHGQHEPMGTDYYITWDITMDAVKLEDAVVFPTGPWLGDMTGVHSVKHPEDSRKRGNVGINTKTLLWLFEELCDEIARNGFDKILIFNGHGGNRDLINSLLRQAARKEKPYKVFYGTASNHPVMQPEPVIKRIMENRDEFPMITDTDIAVLKSWAPTGYQGGHANFLETADIMATRPHLIAPDRYYAEDGINNHRCDYLTDLGINIRGGWSCRYPNSYSGAAPHGCSQSIGQALMKLHVEHAVNVIRTIKNMTI